MPSPWEMTKFGSQGSNNNQMQIYPMEHPVQFKAKKGDVQFWYSGPDGSKSTSNALKLAKKILKEY